MSEMTEESNSESDNQAAEEESASSEQPKKQSRAGIVLLTILVLLALTVAGGGTALGYKAWQDIQVRLEAAESTDQSLENSVSSLEERPGIDVARKELRKVQDGVESNLKQMQQSLASLKKENKALSEAVDKAYKQASRTERGWVLAEIEHVMRMANYRLRLERDFNGAIAALQAADERLHDLSDPQLLPVREQLTNEIYTLKHFEHPDHTGILLKLDRLAAGLKPFSPDVEEASITPASESQLEQPASGEESESASAVSWDDLMNKVRAGLDKHISITDNDEVKSLTDEHEKQQRGYQFLQQKLAAARYAVISRAEEDYKRQLMSAIDWITENSDSKQAQAVKEELVALSKQSIQPKLPDISGSLAMLRTLGKPENADGGK